AGLAQAWIAKARAVAGPGAVRHRPDPDERTAPGRQLAATEAVTPIGRERAAELEALGRLLGGQLLAAGPEVWPRGLGRVLAGGITARGEGVRERQRIAVVAPAAVVVAMARVAIEVTVDMIAARVFLPRDAAVV